MIQEVKESCWHFALARQALVIASVVKNFDSGSLVIDERTPSVFCASFFQLGQDMSLRSENGISVSW